MLFRSVNAFADIQNFDVNKLDEGIKKAILSPDKRAIGKIIESLKRFIESSLKTIEQA